MPTTSARPINRRVVAGAAIEAEIICGVYVVVGYISGDMYIGSSTDVRRRWRQHRSALRKGNHTCRLLQDYWNKHPEQVSFAILRECAEDSLHMVEQEYMDWLRPQLNAAPRAGTSLGRRMTAAQRARLKLRPQSIAIKHDYQGEQLTATEIAKRAGLSLPTIYSRLRDGIPIDAPLKNQPAKPVDVGGGRMMTPHEIAAEIAVPLTTVYSRLNMGWSGTDLLKPKMGRGGRPRRGT